MNVYMDGHPDTSWTRQQRLIQGQLNDAKWYSIRDTFFFFSLISNAKEEK